MPVAEPTNELWALVRQRVPWPDTDEDRASELSRQWLREADRLGETIGKAERTAAEVATAWPDAAGQALSGQLLDSARFRQVEADMRRAAGELDRFAGEVRGVKETIARTIAENYAGYLSTTLLGGPLGAVFGQAFAAKVAEQLAAVVREAADRLRSGPAGAPGATPAKPPPALPPPPPAGSPEQNAAWWNSLSDPQREAIKKQHPEWIGNLDGIPFAVRDEVNRTRLEPERQRLLAERAELIRQYENGEQPFLSSERQAEAEAHRKKLAEIDAKIASIDRIREVIGQKDRSLLVFDTQGERVEAAVGNGDVDKANHVAVFTPGLTTTVNGSLHDYDAQQAAVRDRAQEILARNGRSHETVATVTWLGYQAPQLTPESLTNIDQTVLLDKAARAGADKLNPFLRGIDAARPVDPQLTALGHSYGSTTTGLALLGGTGVDRAGFWGSPGVGTLNPRELGLSPDRILVQENPDDWFVADLGAFGGDPSRLPAIHGETDGAPSPYAGEAPRVGGSGHTRYVERDGTGTHNIAAMVVGEQDDIIPDR